MKSDDNRSRSQKKRDSTALQQCGAELAALAPSRRRALPVPDGLAHALAHLDGISDHEGRRRQMQYIGRLMREMEEEERQRLLAALEGERRADSLAARDLQDIEARREALLHPREEMRRQALAESLEACPGLDAARLAHLVRGALAEREKKRPPRLARELFRYLRDSCGR